MGKYYGKRERGGMNSCVNKHNLCVQKCVCIIDLLALLFIAHSKCVLPEQSHLKSNFFMGNITAFLCSEILDSSSELYLLLNHNTTNEQNKK